MIKFSILLPTHNRLDLLSYAIELVRRQSYDQWEIIVSDNESKEDIKGYIEKLSDSRIRYFRTESFLPVTENWNNAIDKANGDYVIMLGDDDGLLKDSLKELSSTIQSFNHPDFVYSNCALYAYPGVFPDKEKAFYQRPYCPITSGKKFPYLLDKKDALNIVRRSCDFYLPLTYNMQHAVVKKSQIEKMKVDGKFFHSPYPDYYATNALLLTSERILINPTPTVAIGISPKSFGFYYFNNLEEAGNSILNNALTDAQQKKLAKIILPGSAMNTSWLAAMELVCEHFGKTLKLKPNYRRYRSIQILSEYGRSGKTGWARLYPFMRIWERIVYYFIFRSYEKELTFRWNDGQRQAWKSWFKRAWDPYPAYDPLVTTTDALNILDVYEEFDIKDNFITQNQTPYSDHERTSFWVTLFREIKGRFVHFLKHFFFDVRIIALTEWETLVPKSKISLKIRRLAPFSISCRLRNQDTDETIPLSLSSGEIDFNDEIPSGSYFFEILKGKKVYLSCGINFSNPNDEGNTLEWRRNFSIQYTSRIDGLPKNAQENVKFSLITTVYNTPPFYLDKLIDSVLGQTYPHFEWLVLDNGTTSPRTRDLFDEMRNRDSRIKIYSVEKNIHIIPGNRYLFEKANYDWIVPIDSDDILYLDSLLAFSEAVKENPKADLLYSDEHKIDGHDQPISPLLRKNLFSPLYAYSTCPFAHLSAFRREFGQKVGVYSEDYAQGSHDWDTALRFIEAGAKFVHVPKVLYGWRMHAGSSSQNLKSKAYTLTSQKENLRSSLTRRKLADRFVTDTYPIRGFYHLRRIPKNGPLVETHFILRKKEDFKNLIDNIKLTRYDNHRISIHIKSSLDLPSRMEKDIHTVLASKSFKIKSFQSASQLISKIKKTEDPNALIAVVDCSNLIANPYWIWDAVGSFELDPQTSLVSGAIYDKTKKRIHSFGFDAKAKPRFNVDVESLKRSDTLLVREDVDAVYTGFCVFRANSNAAGSFAEHLTDDDIRWCGEIRKSGKRVVCSPYIDAKRANDLLTPESSSSENYS